MIRSLFRRVQLHTALLSMLLLVLFILVGVYLSVHRARVEYYLFLYGRDFVSTHRVFARVLSRDGVTVVAPKLRLNNMRTEYAMLTLDDNIHTITVGVGEDEIAYPVDVAQMEKRSRESAGRVDFTRKELRDNRGGRRVARIGGRRVYLLPETFRMYPEYITAVHVFCFTDNGPCHEKGVTINGEPTEFTDGVWTGRLIMPIGQTLGISFNEGSSAHVPFPYRGRSFMIKNHGDGPVLYTLSQSETVHLDCYKKTEWLFTSIAPGKSSGMRLPSEYDRCTRIQASFDSASPGQSFFVYDVSGTGGVPVRDGYYAALSKDLARHRPDLLDDMKRIYARSVFLPLSVLYNGVEYEEEIMERNESVLSTVWWLIAGVSLLGLVLFIVFMRSRFVTAHDDDGALITMSTKHQYITVVTAGAVVMLFIILLLYFLKNLA